MIVDENLDIERVMFSRYDYPLIIKDTVGLCEYTRLSEFKLREGTPRRINLHISTYKGICSNASHVYGKIEVEGVEFVEECPSDVRSKMSGNHLYKYHYDFDMMRLVTKEDLELTYRYSGEKIFEYYDEGDYTNRFNTIQDVLDMFLYCFKTRFTGAWEIWVDNHVENKYYKLDI